MAGFRAKHISSKCPTLTLAVDCDVTDSATERRLDPVEDRKEPFSKRETFSDVKGTGSGKALLVALLVVDLTDAASEASLRCCVCCDLTETDRTLDMALALEGLKVHDAQDARSLSGTPRKSGPTPKASTASTTKHCKALHTLSCV
jgi:hypothetical protein